ncbi:histone-lysine N-methyltransferase SETDB1-B-like [Odontesthes bonariensis]|uniref:histone-lysine N-methyltransferase SETDB1-B-like n=1 Tax=Odontesthes bonariensis TaxID=219752 RepID=UPI003F583A13
MEGDEMEMSKEDLQRWIRDQVENTWRISPGLLEKYDLLQSLLEKREKQTADLLKLCQSVVAFEEIVKELYSLLGWDYRDSDSDDESTGCGLPTSNGVAPMLPKPNSKGNLETKEEQKSLPILKRNAVVVLTRLSKSKIISALRPRLPPSNSSEDNNSSSFDSDVQWEPIDDSSDSDFCDFNTGSNKRRKIQRRDEKWKRSSRTSQRRNDFTAKVNEIKPSAPQASPKTNAKSNRTEEAASDATKITPKANTEDQAQSKAVTVSKPSANTDASHLTPGSYYAEMTKTAASVPLGKVSVNMQVLARKKELNWQQGKITEIVTKDDGRLKYKVIFKEKGKSLVSGHHIAFDSMPTVSQLFVGARVVVKSKAEEPEFMPGIMAEVPSRKNRMRFLVFSDDRTPVYVGLPLLHLVCRPLADPLGDISNEVHRNYVREYLNRWPFPPQTQYKVGQILNAEYNGIQEKCEVLAVDCSLIHICFSRDQHKEWVYRGSIRLEHMINMRKLVESQKNEGVKNEPKVKVSSESAS